MNLEQLANLLGLFLFLLLLLILIAWVITILMMISKGLEQDAISRSDVGKMWFVGIFASPIILGIYLLLASNGKRNAVTTEMTNSKLDLPEI